jgi:hypothetical protein
MYATVSKRRPLKDAVDLVEHQERAKTLREYFLQNAVPLATGAIFAFVVLKVLLVSRANVNTALSIVERSGTLQILSGVTILAIPSLTTGINNAIAIWAGSASKFNRFERRRLWWIFGISLIYLSFILPWSSTLLLIAFGIYYVTRWFWRRRKVPIGDDLVSTESSSTFDLDEFLAKAPEDVELRRLWSQYKQTHQALCTDPALTEYSEARAEELTKFADIVRSYNERARLVVAASKPTIDAAAVLLLVTVLAPILLQSLNDSVWLPPELISTANHGQVVGYVLSDPPAWTTILRDSDRMIISVPTSELKARAVCHTASQSSRRVTVWNLIVNDRTDYAPCPVGLPKVAG